jgi:hypothetical protein
MMPVEDPAPMRSLCIAAFLASLCFATAAAAGGDVCLHDDDAAVVYRFTRLKLPKASNVAVPVAGVWYEFGSPNASLLQGVVAHTDDLIWTIGFTRYGAPCVVNALLGPAFDGTFYFDCDLDGSYEVNREVQRIDCDTL